MREASPERANMADDGLTRDGITKVVLKEGADGRARILVKGRGQCLRMSSLPLSQDGTVTVQFSNGTACWEARYSTSDENGTTRFKAKAD